MSDKKAYLGDGAYYDHDGNHVVLTTSNGIRANNIIYLDTESLPPLIRALCRDYGADKIKAICDDLPGT